MATVAVLTFSDGRDFVHRDLVDFLATSEQGVVELLEAAGHEVLRAPEPVHANVTATQYARELAAQRPDLTIFSIPVWAFPHFSMLAARATDSPILLLSTLDPKYPGMVAMLATGGALDAIGRRHGRAWGAPNDPELRALVERHVRAAAAVRSLEGTTFGRIGGRPMGMYTAVSSSDEWMSKFGIDVEEIDQLELVRRAEGVDASRVRAGRRWLEANAAGVHYDGRQLTEELLERQLRSYLAMRELIDELHLDFSGIKGQPELTTHFATMDVTEALLNDPYDWEGPKPVHVCATEADMDAALTMQLLHKLSGTPALFADLRHYHADLDVWDLCNSGQHATWFAARSDDPLENLRHVHLYPEDFYFPAGGASVHHLAAPGAFTFARLTRLDGRYRLQAVTGDLVQFEPEVNERLMHASTYHWPHAFARLDVPAAAMLAQYGSNHIHAVPGNWMAELRQVCILAGVDFQPLVADA